MGTNPIIARMVAAEFQRNPLIDTYLLYRRATKLDPTVRSLTLKEFDELYLEPERAPVPPPKKRRRRKKPRRAAEGRKKAPQSPSREGIRSAFLSFARVLAESDSRAELVEAVASVDRFVDEITSGSMPR